MLRQSLWLLFLSILHPAQGHSGQRPYSLAFSLEEGIFTPLHFLCLKCSHDCHWCQNSSTTKMCRKALLQSINGALQSVNAGYQDDTVGERYLLFSLVTWIWAPVKRNDYCKFCFGFTYVFWYSHVYTHTIYFKVYLIIFIYICACECMPWMCRYLQKSEREHLLLELELGARNWI